MKPRVVITVIWLLAFAISIVITESYIHVRTADGLSILFAEDRLSCMKPLVAIYSGYLGGILGFWFLRPFKPARTDAAERVRFWLAVSCSLMFVSVLMFFVSYTYLFGAEEGGCQVHIIMGSKIAGMLSFLVAPVNFYYFGMKLPKA